MESIGVSTYLEQQEDWRKTYGRFFEIADTAFAAGLRLINAVADKGLKDTQITLYQKINTFNTYKSINTLISCTLLCQYGMVEDAKSLVRKLIEIAINLKYVGMEPEKHSLTYARFLVLSKYKQLQEIRKMPYYGSWLKTEFEKLAGDIQKQYDSLKQYYPLNERGEIKGNFLRDWSGKTLGQMALECELGELYSLQYRPFCTATHASVEDVLTYVDFESSKFGYVEKKTMPGILWTCGHSMFMILESFGQAYEIDTESTLSDLLQKLQQTEAALLTTE